MIKVLPTRFSRLLHLLIALGLGATLLLGGVSTANAQADDPEWLVLGGPAVGPDNKTRILWWRTTDNAFSLWSVNHAGTIERSPIFGPFLLPGGSFPEWIAIDIAVGSDNRTRILWRRVTDDAIALWSVNENGTIQSTYLFGPHVGWRAYSIAVGPDDKTRILWRHNNETTTVWTVNTDGVIERSPTFGPFGSGLGSEWFAVDIAVGPDSRTRILWRPTDLSNKTVSLWTLDTSGNIATTYPFGPFPGWEATSSNSITVGSDNRTRILWRRTTDNAYTIWSVNEFGGVENSPIFGPHPNWDALFIGAGPDNWTRILWVRSDEAVALWSVDHFGNIGSTYQFGPF